MQDRLHHGRYRLRAPARGGYYLRNSPAGRVCQAFSFRARSPHRGLSVMRQQLAGVLCALSTLMVAGCASQTGVVPNGQGGYLIAKQAATGLPGLGNLKAEAMVEANQYCQSQGREFLLTSETE